MSAERNVEVVRRAVIIRLVLLGTIVGAGGCFPTIYVPKVQVDRIALKPLLKDPVYAGPGGIGPIFSMPKINYPGKCCPPCGDCCAPSSPLQPVDPFGWLKSGSMGSQEIDPVGWVFGL
jgi:hypothetical protein